MCKPRNSPRGNSSNHIYKIVTEGSSSPQSLDKTEVIYQEYTNKATNTVIKALNIFPFGGFCEIVFIRIPGFIGQTDKLTVTGAATGICSYLYLYSL